MADRKGMWQTQRWGRGRHRGGGMADTEVGVWQTQRWGHGRHRGGGVADTEVGAWKTERGRGRHRGGGVVDTEIRREYHPGLILWSELRRGAANGEMRR